MMRNQSNQINGKNSSLFDVPISEKSEPSENDSLKNSTANNRRSTKNMYRQSRDTILRKANVLGARPINQKAPIKDTEKVIELKDVIDMRCIEFLKKNYSFYD